MLKIVGIIALTLTGAVAVGTAFAGTENVKFPAGYADKMVRYHSVDKTSKRFGPSHRIFFINREALTAVKAGRALPSGTVIVREDWSVKTDGNKNAIKDDKGHFIKIKKKGAQIMEKRDGWGVDYPPTMRNGNWEYASFMANGKRNTKRKVKGCFGCHMGKKADDFVFSMKELRAAANK